MSTGAALEDGDASRTAADGFPRVKKCVAEPAAAAEGDARAGASTAARVRTLPGVWRCRAILPNNIWYLRGPLDAVYIIFMLIGVRKNVTRRTSG